LQTQLLDVEIVGALALLLGPLLRLVALCDRRP